MGLGNRVCNGVIVEAGKIIGVVVMVGGSVGIEVGDEAETTLDAFGFGVQKVVDFDAGVEYEFGEILSFRYL